MTSTDKMIDLLAEACSIALGKEWTEADDQKKHDIIMGFIAEAARRGAAAKNGRS